MPSPFAAQPPVSAVDTERQIEEMLHLFLKEWFDGDLHTLDLADAATVDLRFPLCQFAHGAAELPRESGGLPLIHTVIRSATPVRTDRFSEVDRVLETRAAWTHFVRAAHSASTDGARSRSRIACRQVADRLRLLYQHAPKLDLARKGFLRCKLESGPVEIPAPGYSLRQMSVTATFRLRQKVSVAG